MNSARIVGDHSAERIPAVRRRIRAERQMMFFGRVAQCVQNAARLDPRQSPLRIEFDDVAHVLREIDHHGHVDALARNARAAAARQNRRAVAPAGRDR
jgi:hypothetical protein